MTSLLVFVALLLFTVEQASSQCCDFEPSTTCSYTLNPWKSSYIDGPPVTTSLYPGFTPSSNYLWLEDNSGAMSTSTVISIADESTYINFDYYYNNHDFAIGSYLHIFFQPVGSSNKYLLVEITTPADQWLNRNVPCSVDVNYCCGSALAFPCSGTLQVIGQLTNTPTSGLFGIDNIGTCNQKSFCCDFDSSTSCGFLNAPTNEVNWFNSLTVPPSIGIPPPESHSQFAYFDLASYVDPSQAMENDYASEVFDIPSAQQFRGYFYAFSDGAASGGKSGLSVRFREQSTGVTTELIFIQLTGWAEIDFQCGDIDHDCCVGLGNCAGQLVLTAHVEGIDSTLSYAVDTIGVNGCTPFPGKGEFREIKFGHSRK